jgi:glycosyltransferase involved in cell wall biosynthesis
MTRRILFVQFADPTAYPPLEHVSRLLADHGWNVVLLGIGASGIDNLRFPSHPRITIKNFKFVPGGWRQKVNYSFLFVRALYWVLWWKPQWIYASDPPACPIAWIIHKISGVRVVYHEHDSPNWHSESWFTRQIQAFRNRIGVDADLCILPQRERGLIFVEATKREKPVFIVWNCPRLDEVPQLRSSESAEMVVYYHGSITRARVPRELIVAASRFRGAVRVRLAGYETEGSIGYVDELMRVAASNGAEGIVEPIGVIPRYDLLQCASQAQIGLSLMPRRSDDINMRHMVGASNKSFDYMASGLPLVVTDLPDWVETFVDGGYALACNPEDADSIEHVLRWFLEHPEERRRMGERGRDRIVQEWNHDRMFAGILASLERV